MKVNDYVRTKDGLIHKITDIFNTTKQVATDKGKYVYEYNEVVKSSPNIIDLIEVGDYVKSNFGLEGKVEIIMPPLKIWIDAEEVLYDEIKSIVTKEQFERCEYKI